MHVIKLNQQEYTAPSSWDGLDKDSLLRIASITGLKRFRHMIPYYLVMCLFDIPKNIFVKLRQCQFIQLETCLGWLSQKNNLIKWLLPRVKAGLKNFYGPKDRLADLTVEEFMYAEGAYARWLDTQQPDLLRSLFAALYHRRSFFNRRHFNERDYERDERFALKIAQSTLKAIALNYAGCRNFIIDRHPNIWKVDEGTNGKPLLESGQLQKVNWPSLALELSGDKFGTYNQTIKMNLWLFLADMDKKAKQAAELEAKR